LFYTVPVEREIYVKEESSKTYSAFSYFIGKTLLEIPLAFFFPLLYAAIGYWMSGLTQDP
jgi:ABC-type multidrug transport system permease subunit